MALFAPRLERWNLTPDAGVIEGAWAKGPVRRARRGAGHATIIDAGCCVVWSMAGGHPPDALNVAEIAAARWTADYSTACRTIAGVQPGSSVLAGCEAVTMPRNGWVIE